MVGDSAPFRESSQSADGSTLGGRVGTSGGLSSCVFIGQSLFKLCASLCRSRTRHASGLASDQQPARITAQHLDPHKVGDPYDRRGLLLHQGPALPVVADPIQPGAGNLRRPPGSEAPATGLGVVSPPALGRWAVKAIRPGVFRSQLEQRNVQIGRGLKLCRKPFGVVFGRGTAADLASASFRSKKAGFA